MASQRFNPLAFAAATVRASARAGSELGSDASQAAGRVLARRGTAALQTVGQVTRSVVNADVGVGPVRLSPASVEWARQQVAAGLRTLLALPEDTADRLRSADPTVMARAVLALVGGEEALLELPSPDEQIRLRFRTLLDPGSIDGEGLAPALLTITSQLSPDEARILRHLDSADRTPIVDVEAGTRTARGGPVVAEHLSMVVERAGGDAPGRGPQYVANLVRLGLCSVEDDEVSGHPDHALIEASEPFLEAVSRIRADRGRPRVRRRSLRLSPLGRQLVRIALHDDAILTTATLDGPPPPPPAALRAPQLTSGPR